MVSTITLTNVTFNTPGSSDLTYNVFADGDVSGTSWTFVGAGGGFWGPDYEYDPGDSSIAWDIPADVGLRYWIASSDGNWNDQNDETRLTTLKSCCVARSPSTR